MKLGTIGKIGVSWAFIVTFGVYGFYLTRESVVAQRTEHMKVRERMRQSNSGDYEASIRKYAN